MTQTEKSKNPVYRGMTRHVNNMEGWAIWTPNDWVRTPMTGDHSGILLTPPGAKDFDTCMAVEKHILPFAVVAGDVPELRKGIEQGLKSLPGIEVEWQVEQTTGTLLFFDVRYSFLENDERRKRWLRNIYWGEAQLVVIAQGKTVDVYDYWRPVFFNSMMTLEIGTPV